MRKNICKSGEFSLAKNKITETDGILTREKFLETLDKANFGLARPNLLILISQYELIIHIEEDWKKRNIDEWEGLSKEKQQELDNNPEIKKILKEKVKVERLLVEEIIGGYAETVRNLGIGNEYKSVDYFNVKIN